jgi:4-amino-4-deoxychorismate lyase
MDTAWLIDGVKQPGLPLDDRGFAYGDGLFETIAAPNGRVRRFDSHYERLTASCERLNFSAPSFALLEADVDRIVTPGTDCVVKIIVTRGSGGRGYRPPEFPSPRRIVGVFPWPDYPPDRYTDGVRVIRCETRLAENPALAGMKHLCRLEQVLAQSEVAAAGAHEGIVRSVSGRIISGTMSNLFAVKTSALITPVIDRCGVAGVMRSAIIDAARRSDIPVSEQVMDPAMLETADELFLSNSIIGIWPISVLEGVAFSVGPLTQSLMRQLGVYPRQSDYDS